MMRSPAAFVGTCCVLCLLLCQNVNALQASNRQQESSSASWGEGLKALAKVGRHLGHAWNESVTRSVEAAAAMEKPFDCETYPKLCMEPFNCKDYKTSRAMALWASSGYASSGHANPKTWCAAPWYYEYASQCLQSRDLEKAAQIQYEETVSGKFGPSTADADGSYCFLDGHCTNSQVTKDTTLEEAEKQCDERYGREAWAKYGSMARPIQDKLGYGLIDGHLQLRSLKNGFNTSAQTRPFLLAACAMGNYHCDVMYCKETYCQKEYYVQKFGHHLKENGHDDGSYVTNFAEKQRRDPSYGK